MDKADTLTFLNFLKKNYRNSGNPCEDAIRQLTNYNRLKNKIADKKLSPQQVKQIESFIMRIYSITNIFQLKDLFEVDINHFSKHFKGTGNPYSFLDGPLWAIPSTQGKYKNQRFVSKKVFEDKLTGSNQEITSESDLRLEHVIDRKACKLFIVEKKDVHKIFELLKLNVGCVIHKYDSSKLGQMDFDFLDEIIYFKDIFRKYYTISLRTNHLTESKKNHLREKLEGALIQIKNMSKINFDICEKEVLTGWNDNDDKFKKNAFKETGVGRKIITLKKNDILVKNGENRDGNSYKRKKVDLLNNKEFKFYLTSDLADIINDSDCPYQLEWTVNVLDRQIGHFLECNHHPYNSCGHKDFIKGIFNIDLQYTGDFNDWLENIPKVDKQFLSQSKIKKEWKRKRCKCNTI